MQCTENLDFYFSILLFFVGLLFLFRQLAEPAGYGKHVLRKASQTDILVPAKYGWFIQELPSFLVPLMVTLYNQGCDTVGCQMLFFMFCGHYFQRTFIYSFLTRGRPLPLHIVLSAVLFCTYNGFLQSHCMIYVAAYPQDWYKDFRFTSGAIIFFLGMGINVHSDYILRKLRKPSEVTYKIPQACIKIGLFQFMYVLYIICFCILPVVALFYFLIFLGGMFNYVSGANFLGEIVEWFGYAVATWSLPAFAFALFTLCSIGPRAYHHHRFYLQEFKDYPKERRALIPFIF